MATKVTLNKYSIYKYRYWIGYSLLALVLTATMVIAATLIPGGLDQNEQASALKSASLNLSSPESLLVIDLPYHALQKISITLLGLSSFSIKLPSVILAVLSIAGLVLVYRRWFSRNISVAAAATVASFTSFIYAAQYGTPDIMHIFWPVLTLLLLTLIPEKNYIGLTAAVLAGLAAGLSVMTPIGTLPLMALATGGLLHPHIRHVIRTRVDMRKRIVLGVSFIVGLAPTLLMLITRPDTGLALIFKDSFSGSLLESAKESSMRFLDFTGVYSNIAESIVPVFTLATLSICIVGYYALLKKRHTTQHYILTAWLILLVPAVLFAIENITYILLVPFALLLAAGIQFILRQWYRLFPQNPYARVFGLLPVTVLILGITTLGILRYAYSYTYHPVLANVVSHDLATVDKIVKNQDSKSGEIIIATSEEDRSFYQLYVDVNEVNARVQPNPDSGTINHGTVIALRDSPLVSNSEVDPYRIVASASLHERSDRVYIYKKQAD